MGHCARFLQFLISATLFLFRFFFFPVFFGVALFAFFFFALSFYVHALPADQLPADKKPAKSCKVWKPSGLGSQTASIPGSCDPVSAAEMHPDLSLFGWCTRSGMPAGASWEDSFASRVNSDCTKTVSPDGPAVTSRNVSASVITTSTIKSTGESADSIPALVTIQVFHSHDSYSCPPDGHPEYDTIVESDEGYKYCLKSGPDTQCEEKAGQILSGISKYYKADSDSALQSDCEGSCELVAASVGICADYVMPSGTVILQCSVAESKYTGNPCPYDLDGESPLEQYDDAKPKEPNSEKSDCVYQYNAALGQSECTGVETVENPGTKSCGHINGVFTCVDNADGGSKTTTTEKTKKETTDPETGNVTTTETATVTTETCKGDSCTTKTATTTTSTTVNGSGSVVGSSSTCTGDGCGAGSPGDGGGLGDLYTPTDKTYRSAVDDFRARISAAPVLTSLGAFLTIGASGSCPVWSVTIPVFGAITIDQQCSEVMAGIWVVISAVLLATAAFFSFRIAFL